MLVWGREGHSVLPRKTIRISGAVGKIGRGLGKIQIGNLKKKRGAQKNFSAQKMVGAVRKQGLQKKEYRTVANRSDGYCKAKEGCC